jgi:fido (protein-threonine AMPylation protein)
MNQVCSALLNEIIADPARRRTILSDPRSLHLELFAPFAPPDHAEYAGNYRGTTGTTIADRTISAESQLDPGTQYVFCAASRVPASMDWLSQRIQHLMETRSQDDFTNLIALTYVFCWFGRIHPFLDGNGHVQRAIFAAMATELKYPLSARFSIHPRPYDRLLGIALEMFTRAPTHEADRELGLVAEYLGFFLDGPFNAPRKNLGTASPYI